jgi:hypothetical protein
MSTSTAPNPPAAPRGHCWYEPLKVWYRPAARPTRRPSPDHVWCPDLPGWAYLPITDSQP